MLPVPMALPYWLPRAASSNLPNMSLRLLRTNPRTRRNPSLPSVQAMKNLPQAVGHWLRIAAEVRPGLRLSSAEALEWAQQASGDPFFRAAQGVEDYLYDLEMSADMEGEDGLAVDLRSAKRAVRTERSRLEASQDPQLKEYHAEVDAAHKQALMQQAAERDQAARAARAAELAPFYAASEEAARIREQARAAERKYELWLRNDDGSESPGMHRRMHEEVQDHKRRAEEAERYAESLRPKRNPAR